MVLPGCVFSLYINSTQAGVVCTAIFPFEKSQHELPPDKIIVEGIKFSLEHNYFVFFNDFYLQVHGIAMGTNYALSYANITMGYW